MHNFKVSVDATTILTQGGFVGLTMDAEVWDHSTFTANRDRLLNEKITRVFFGRVLAGAEWQELVSDDHFTVDGTLIEAWASMRRFQPKRFPSNQHRVHQNGDAAT